MKRDVFNDIIHKYNRKFFSTAYCILRNQQEAEDVTQNVFMKMWLMGNKLDEYADIEALGITMIKNNCLDMLRKWKHIDGEKDGSENSDPDPSPSPYEEMVKSEERTILNHIIDNLPPLYRDLVQLREINGFSYEEIADQVKVNVNTLRVTLSRARKLIKEKYLEYINDRG